MLIALITSVGGFQIWKVTHDHRIRKEVKVEIAVESKKDGVKRNDQASKARDRVATDDKHFKRLLKQYCRDC